MKYKMCFAFVCLVICLFAVAGVSASDANETASIDLIGNDNHNGETAGNIVRGNFTELANSIENTSEDSVLSLDRDYEYDSGNTEGILINKSITIDGKDHVLDGANASRIFLISNSNVTLKNLIFKNGFGDDGGAIQLSNSTLSISNCTFINNRANAGGGAIYASLSNVSIEGCEFSRNFGEGLYVSGGAVHLFNSSADISSSRFSNNSADAGGAIFGLGSSLDLKSSELSYNEASFYGGGVFFEFFLKINSTVFHDNRAGLRGGAVHASYLTEDNGIMVLILNSKIFSNTASYGAVISRISESYIEIINCDCRGNEAINGTVVYAPSCGNITLKRSNFTNNSGEYGCLVYTIQGRTLMKLSDYNITVYGCNVSDNYGSDSLIYNFYGNLIIENSSFVCENGQYRIFVIKKLASGNVSFENNWWGVENPDLSGLIYINDTVQNQSNDLSSNNYNDDCSSNVIQIDENHTVSSYRRDSSKEIPLFIGGDGEVRQEKVDVTYFFHMIVTAGGWVLGNGGLDMPYLTERIEGLARKMIESNEISMAYLEIIFSMKSYVYNWGHFIIKSPDGRYAIVDYFNKTKAIETGVLKSGEYILSPNNYALHKKGNVSDLPVSGYVEASRYLAATDLYGKPRTTIQTYEYAREVSSGRIVTRVDCHVANDDGSLRNASFQKNFNDIFASGRYIPGEEIPLIMNGEYLGRFVLDEVLLPPAETKIIAGDLQIVYNKGKYLTVELRDVSGNLLSNADLKIQLNGKVYNRVTDSSGQAKLFVNLVPKTYKVSISFAGNERYVKSSKEVKITVKKATPKISAKNRKFKRSLKVKKYTVILKNNIKKPIKKAIITIKIKKKTFRAKTNAKGKATFKIRKLTKKGTYKAKLTFKGNKYYNKVVKKVKIKIR